jgi:hypothetical protein
VFAIEDVQGLSSLEGSSLERVVSFAVTRTSVQRLDLTGVQASYLNVSANFELRSLSFASGEVKQLTLHANPVLDELSWAQGFTVRDQLVIDSNSALSSCLVQQFAEQTDAGVRRMDFIRSNGPCP